MPCLPFHPSILVRLRDRPGLWWEREGVGGGRTLVIPFRDGIVRVTEFEAVTTTDIIRQDGQAPGFGAAA